MGRNSGGNNTGAGPGDLGEGDSGYRGSITNVQSLVHMKDKQLYKETKQAISRYHAVMGVRERNVKLADMDKSVMGVQASVGGQSTAVYLNKKYYNKSAGEFKENIQRQYKSGWQTETNRPTAHVTTHELAHSTWNSSLTAANAQAAGKEISKLYRKWRGDKTKKGYGRYSMTNVNEFWAETVTKAVHGRSDKYTTAVKRIARKYKL